MRSSSKRFDTVDLANDDSSIICWSVLYYVFQLLATFYDVFSETEKIDYQDRNSFEAYYHALWHIGNFLRIVTLCCELSLLIYVIVKSCSGRDNKVQEKIFLGTKTTFFLGFLKDIIVSVAKIFLAMHHDELKAQLQGGTQGWACKVTCFVSLAHFVLFIAQSWYKRKEFCSYDLAGCNQFVTISGCIAFCSTVCILSL